MKIDREVLERQLKTRWAGRVIRQFEDIDSTNLEAVRQFKEGAPHGTLVIAESQAAGKGRLGRAWISPEGTGIWMSLLLKPALAPWSASMLTLVCAMAVTKGIREAAGLETQIKWPNDVVWNGRKLCGILTEMSTREQEIRYVVTGVGINVNMTEFPEQAGGQAVSLRQALGHPVERETLIARILEAFEAYYEVFEAAKDLSGLRDEYNRQLVNLGRQVKVLDPMEPFQGEALGIDSQGNLLVKMPDGGIRTVRSGEVSVRGIYGYAL